MFPIIRKNYSLPDQLALGMIMFVVWLANSGCFTRTEGCLDIAAENFDLDADRSCDDCCTYPSISLSISQKWNDINFSTNDTFYDRNSKPYRIIDLNYLLSSFAWINSEDVFTIDSSEIECVPQPVRYTPDLIQVDSRQFTYVIDTISVYPSIDSLVLKLGWVAELDCVDETDDEIPVVLSDESPLWDSVINARAAIRMVIQRDPAIETYDTVYIHTCNTIRLGYVEAFELGRPKTLKLTVNYALWLSNVNVDDLHTFQNSILSGIPGSFTRTP